MSRTCLARRKSFQCLHRYSVDAWTDEKNLETFGACFTPHGHGHRYVLEAFLQGPVDPITGMIINLRDFDRILEETVSSLEGKHLNFEVGEFHDTVPTTEALATWILERLARRFEFPVEVMKIRLYESEDLWVEAWP